VARPGEVVRLQGRAAALLSAERTALNFLQRLSGVATLAARCVATVHGTRARILDTRKTTPGLRRLEKAAVAAGGASNHRAGLYDAILIKENHIAIAGGLGEAVRQAQERAPPGFCSTICPLISCARPSPTWPGGRSSKPAAGSRCRRSGRSRRPA